MGGVHVYLMRPHSRGVSGALYPQSAPDITL